MKNKDYMSTNISGDQTEPNSADDLTLESMLDEKLNRLHAVWRGLAQGNKTHAPNGLPYRKDFALIDVADMIPCLTIMRRYGPQDITISMIGTAIDSLSTRPVTGMNIFDLVKPSMRYNVASLYGALLDHPAGALVSEFVGSGIDASRYSHSKMRLITTLYLPLCDRRGHANYIIGCSTSKIPSNFGHPVSRQGRRLIDHIVTRNRQLAGLKFIDIGHGLPNPAFDIPSEHEATRLSSTDQVDMAGAQPKAKEKHWWNSLFS